MVLLIVIFVSLTGLGSSVYRISGQNLVPVNLDEVGKLKGDAGLTLSYYKVESFFDKS